MQRSLLADDNIVADDNIEWLVPLESEENAWKALPKPLGGQTLPLPTWARMLATRLPLTTASLLELDYAHRTKSPVAPELRAAMRYTIAAANQCDYAKQAALYDLHKTVASHSQRESLVKGTFEGWSQDHVKALAFARKMSLASASIKDEEFQGLLNAFGEHETASMVLLTAYANMQDRLLMCLRADAAIDASSGALGPINVAFSPSDFDLERRHPPVTESLDLPANREDQAASAGSIQSQQRGSAQSQQRYEQLQEMLETQRSKPTRLSILPWSKVSEKIPSGMFNGPSEIVWYRTVFGYAPELAIPFERTMRVSGSETSRVYGRIFGTSLFWVVTSAVECPYCMGHCEMNWEVAGLSKSQIARRSLELASDDWSAFPQEQQHAFAFAKKLSRSPSSIMRQDLMTLKQHYGDDGALAIAFHLSRYHYMTRISNGFQLKLERENVFFDYWNKRKDAGQSNHRPRPWVQIPSHEETWNRLPALAQGEKTALPIWARAIATELPRTAAAMLELDHAQRALTPLDPKLRAKMRWIIAKANRCKATQLIAIADLRRAGATDSECDILTGDPTHWFEEDREPLEFAELMTLAAPSIQDEMFERLKTRYGERKIAAMVLLAAYGNFQDRIVLGLGLDLAEDEPMQELAVKFAEGALQIGPILPLENGVDAYKTDDELVVTRDTSWTAVTYEQLQRGLEHQRNRKPRLPIPTWESVAGLLPPAMAVKPTRIHWSLVNYGYASELAIPWSIATRTHWSEAPSERILEESAFWVQTRAIQCNYCMGHCEMLMEEAGLKPSAIEHRTKLLAESDWKMFPVAEQRVYHYARKLSKTPWDLNAQDYQSLVDEFGPKKAMGLFWWLCRGLYMTRISDGFQLTLERENVFANHGVVIKTPNEK